MPFSRATSFSRTVTSRVNDAMESSNLFFSLRANAMYVDRIFEP